MPLSRSGWGETFLIGIFIVGGTLLSVSHCF